MARRQYVVGLPVVIYVDDDGTVTAEVDLSEASDLSDASVESDETGVPLPEYTDERVSADETIVEDAVVQARVVLK